MKSLGSFVIIDFASFMAEEYFPCFMSFCIPLILLGVFALIIVFVVIVGIIWWRRSKTVKKETAQLHPFQVTSDLEMALTNADNENFPLKTNCWDLTFGLQKAKAIIEQEYEETVHPQDCECSWF